MSLQKRGIFYQKGNLFPHLNAKTPKKGKYFSLQKGHNYLSPTALRAFTICIYKYIQNALFSFQGRTMANKQVNRLKATRVRTRATPSPRQSPVEIYFPKWPAPGTPWGVDHEMHANLRDWGDVITKPYQSFESKPNQPEPRGVAPAGRGAVRAKPASRPASTLEANQPACRPVSGTGRPEAGSQPAGRKPKPTPKPHRIVTT